MFRPGYRWNCWFGFWRNLQHCWYDLKSGIRNIFIWLPIIWFDQDWDWCFLATLLEFKLRKMATYIGDHDRHMSAKRDAQRMRLCAELIKRVRDDEYYEKLAGPLTYKDWTTPTDDPQLVQFHIEAYRPDGSKQSDEECRRLNRQANEQRSRELQLFGKILGKHMLSWWD